MKTIIEILETAKIDPWVETDKEKLCKAIQELLTYIEYHDV